MQLFTLEPYLEQISRSESFENLRAIRDQATETLHGSPHLQDGIGWNAIVNDVHDAVIAKAVSLAEARMQRRGLQRPGGTYAMLLFGSGGRREQTLWSDQDNGLVYADPEQEAEERTGLYYEQFAETIVEGLEIVGYPRCEGNVVCTNPSWRKPLSAWFDMTRGWLEDPIWEHVRYLLVTADVRPICGDARLADEIKRYFLAYVKSHSGILEHLLQNTLHRKVSLGPFGQLIRERYGEDAGGVDIKYGSYIPFVNGIRLLAICEGITASSTLERIEALRQGGYAAPALADEWKEAMRINLQLRSLTPFQLEEGRYTTRGKLPAGDLTKERKHDLKVSLKTGSHLQKYVKGVVHEMTGKGKTE